MRTDLQNIEDVVDGFDGSEHDMRSRPSVPVPGSGLRVFEVTVIAWSPQVSVIYAALSASKAKFAAWKSAQNAGYDLIKCGDLRVRRAPEFDGIAAQLKRGVDRTTARLLLQSQNAVALPTASNDAPNT